MEGGDDGGVYVAAIQTLEGSETAEEERKKGGQKERTLHYSKVQDNRLTSLLTRTAVTFDPLTSALLTATPTWTCRQMVKLLFLETKLEGESGRG